MARDTIKIVEDNEVKETLSREKLFIVQTPQTFDFRKLLNAHEKSRKENIYGTDDSYLMERAGYKITINEGSPLNFKLTTKEDLILANCIVRKR